MSNSYKVRRHKLKSHDAGEDRHNKNLAWMHKANRLDREHDITLQHAAERRRAQAQTVARPSKKKAKKRSAPERDQFLQIQEETVTWVVKERVRWSVRRVSVEPEDRRVLPREERNEPTYPLEQQLRPMVPVQVQPTVGQQQLRPIAEVGVEAMRRHAS